MKRVYHRLVRFYLRLGLNMYFSRIEVHDLHHIPTDSPVIFTSNHQNAFLDALLLAVYNSRFSIFLTRASVFRNPVAARLLKSLDMYPVFRVRDGWQTIQKNDEVFNLCVERLHSNGSVVIFPEGNHDLGRRLRPLSKGFTRIAFGTLSKYPELKVRIVPVGINYQSHTRSRFGVSLYFGEPVLANGFYNAGNLQRSSQALRTAVSEKMKRLITHLPEEHEETAGLLTDMGYDYLDPFATNSAIRTDKFEKQDLEKPSSVFRILRFPLYPFAALVNALPFLTWQILKKSMRDPVFEGSFKFALSISVFPILYFLQSATVAYFFGILPAITILAFSIFSIPVLRGR